MKRSDEQLIEKYFMQADGQAAACMLERINLIMRTRGLAPEQPKRGRPRKPKTAQEPQP